MSEIQLASSSQRNVWRNDYFREFIRQTGFKPYMGTGKNNIFRVGEDLIDKAGKTVHFPMISALRGNGVRGNQILVGNEDDQANADDAVSVDWVRNGLVVPKSTTYQTEIDLWNAAKDGLKEWSADQLKFDLVDALGGIIIPGAALSVGNAVDTWTSYANATAGQRNTYLTNNSDRMLFGALVANSSSNVFATALATVDSVNDKLSPTIASIARDLADVTGKSNASFPNRTAITPYKQEDGVYTGMVMFCAPNSFRDLKTNATMTQANRDARPRSVEANPLFQDGDLIYDGIIFRKIPELARLTIAGGADCNVDRNFLCGQSAAIIGWGQRPKPVTKKEDDYGFRPGTGIEELRGQKKASYNGTMYGCVEVLTASVNPA